MFRVSLVLLNPKSPSPKSVSLEKRFVASSSSRIGLHTHTHTHTHIHTYIRYGRNGRTVFGIGVGAFRSRRRGRDGDYLRVRRQRGVEFGALLFYVFFFVFLMSFCSSSSGDHHHHHHHLFVLLWWCFCWNGMRSSIALTAIGTLFLRILFLRILGLHR